MERTHFSISLRHLKHLPEVAKDLGIGEGITPEDMLTLIGACWTVEKEIADADKAEKKEKQLERLEARVDAAEQKKAAPKKKGAKAASATEKRIAELQEKLKTMKEAAEEE